MSDEDDIVKFAAILDEFAAGQRKLALSETRKQRLTMMRGVGEGCQVSFETVIDEGTEPAEIYKILDAVDQALSRLKAKSDLSDHYFRMLNDCGQIEMTQKKLASEQLTFEAENAVRNANRRVAVTLTSGQRVALDNYRQSIRDLFERLAEKQKAAAECRRILDGEDPFRVLDDQIRERIAQLRGGSAAAAA